MYAPGHFRPSHPVLPPGHFRFVPKADPTARAWRRQLLKILVDDLRQANSRVQQLLLHESSASLSNVLPFSSVSTRQLSQALWSSTFASAPVELLSRHRVRPL